jgi:FKBP-type peptidyl-prolyl cis-trans isomerase FklB
VICSERNIFKRAVFDRAGIADCNFEPNADNERLKMELMKRTALIFAFCLSAAAPLFAADTNVLTDEKSRLSYSIGMMFANRWKEQGVEVDPDLVLRGLKDGQSGAPTLLSQQEMHDLIDKFEKALAEKQQAMRDQLLAKNKAEGEAFLAKNKSQPGVVTLPDGLQYKIVTEGNGESPGDNDVVTVNYRGTFIDGTEFGNSTKDGKPLQIPINRLFRGWQEALKLMKTGSKWQLFIPAELAYGQQGTRGIAPNSVLIFDAELLAVRHPDPQLVPLPPPSANTPLTSDIVKVPSAEEMNKGAKIEIIKAEDVQKIQQAQTNAAK